MRPSRLLVAALWAGALLSLPTLRSARAEVSSGSGSQCVLKGMPVMPANLGIYDQASGGSEIARFTGAETALAASDFPGGASGRASIRTGTGTGNFRIAGYVDASRIPIFTARKVAVVAGHLWLSEERRVRVIGASPGQLRVELRVSTPIDQTFKTQASCTDLALVQTTPPGWTVPGHARGYVVKQEEVKVYDGPGRNLVTILHRAPASTGILLWSTERQGAWVHVEYHGDVTLDAWAHASDLHALPPGETMDELHSPTLQHGAPQLALAQKPELVKTTKQVPLRTAANDRSPLIGLIEADTETYVLDVVAGWASVLPKAMNIAPPSGGQFWVKAADLGLP